MIIKITLSVLKNNYSGGMKINSRYRIGCGIILRNQDVFAKTILFSRMAHTH